MSGRPGSSRRASDAPDPFHGPPPSGPSQARCSRCVSPCPLPRVPPRPPVAPEPRTSPINRSVHVAAKVVAVVDVSFTCDPFLVMDPATGTSGGVDHRSPRRSAASRLTQASGKSVAVASASFDNATVVCDGVDPAHEPMVLMATTFPWKSGAAVAIGSSPGLLRRVRVKRLRRKRPRHREARQVAPALSRIGRQIASRRRRAGRKERAHRQMRERAADPANARQGARWRPP